VKRALIIGGSGFIGRYLVARLLSKLRLTATYSRHPFSVEGVETLPCDMTDPAALSALVQGCRPEVIIHAAAMRDPDRCERDPDLAARVNVDPVGTIARLAEECGAALVYFSTDLVLDGRGAMSSEDDPPRPLNVYGETKLRGERAALAGCARSLVLRLALSYGRGHPPHTSFTDWMAGALSAGRRIDLYTDQYRSAIYAGDVAGAVDLLLRSGAAWSGAAGSKRILNLAGPERLSRYDFGLLFCRVFGYDVSLIRPTPMPAGSGEGQAARPPDCSLDISRLFSLPYAPAGAAEGIARMRDEGPPA